MKKLLLALALTTASGQAMAQDVVIMRRTIALPTRQPGATPTPAPGTATPTPAPAVVGHWAIGDPVVQPGCTATSPTLAPVTCRDASDAEVAASACADAKPSGAGTAPSYATCSYTWTTGTWSAWSPTCSKTAQRTRTVTCHREDGSHTLVDGSRCDPASADAATSEGPTEVTSSCTYAAMYSTTFGACVNNVKTAPIVSCQRSDGTPADNALCGAQTTTAPCGGYVCTAASTKNVTNNVYSSLGRSYTGTPAADMKAAVEAMPVTHNVIIYSVSAGGMYPAGTVISSGGGAVAPQFNSVDAGATWYSCVPR